MNVLVTGATGLVGSNLVRRLVSAGVRPRLLVRERSDRRGLRGLAFDEVVGDVLDAASLRRALEGVDRVFHVAGSVRMDRGAAAELCRVNVEGTKGLVTAAREAGVRRVVHVSSVSAISPGSKAEPATEEAPPPESPLPYPKSKLRAEAAALEAAGALELVIASPGFVIGPYDVKPTSGALLIAVARGRLPVYPSGGNNFVNAADVAQGLFLAMEKGRPGQRYILGGENLTYRELLSLCAEEAGVRPPWLGIPMGLALGAAALADRLADRWEVGNGWPTRAHVLAAYTPTYYSSQKAVRELGYTPRPLRLGVREAYRWFQEEGYLERDRPLYPRGEGGHANPDGLPQRGRRDST
ncbi:MAG: NAD-dependent epimerase/dehydratase family protein [Myxococcales bacterium]|nr:NAD-dependent epimerase/dehydratase family protein [Myxococcales bacterium]